MQAGLLLLVIFFSFCWRGELLLLLASKATAVISEQDDCCCCSWASVGASRAAAIDYLIFVVGVSRFGHLLSCAPSQAGVQLVLFLKQMPPRRAAPVEHPSRRARTAHLLLATGVRPQAAPPLTEAKAVGRLQWPKIV